MKFFEISKLVPNAKKRWYRGRLRLTNIVINARNSLGRVWRGVAAFGLAIAFAGSVRFADSLIASLERLSGKQIPEEAAGAFTLAIGASLIGATAVVFSLVLFAMQVSVERAPFGLFRRISTDWRLLGAFVVALVVATATAVLSIVVGPSTKDVVIVLAVWAVVATGGLLFYSYGRALTLISPVEQVRQVCRFAIARLSWWELRANWSGHIQAQEVNAPSDETRHDKARLLFFAAHSQWLEAASQALKYLAAYARNYARSGDHEMARFALASYGPLVSAYISAKGRTFFSPNWVFENPLATDGFINELLEQHRQLFAFALQNRDEEFMEAILQSFGTMAGVLSSIDYPEGHEKWHAKLCAGYACNALKSVLPHDLPDVCMDGAERLTGMGAMFLSLKADSSLSDIPDSLTTVGCVGAVRPSFVPVSQVCVRGLSKLLLAALVRSERDVRFLAKDLTSAIDLIATTFVKLAKKRTIGSDEQTALAGFYSPTDPSGFLVSLRATAEFIRQKPAGDQQAESLIRNLLEWVDRQHIAKRELLQAALEADSHLAFDLMAWVSDVARFLMAIAKAESCPSRMSGELIDAAVRMAAVFSWIPDTAESWRRAEVWGLTRVLSEMGRAALHSESAEVVAMTVNVLVGNAAKSAKHEAGFDTPTQCLMAAIALQLASGGAVADVVAQAVKGFTVPGAATRETIEAVCDRLREQAEEFPRYGSSWSEIEQVLRGQPPQTVRESLKAMADALAVVTSGDGHRADG